VGTFQDALRSGEPGPRQQGRGHPRVRAPAGVQPLGPRPIGEVLDDAGGLAAADAERVDQLILVEAVEPPGRGRRREARRDRRRVEVARVQLPRHGEADAAHHLHRGDQRLQHGAAAGAGRLAHGQRGGDGHAARVDDGVLPRVVEVQPVGERGVGEHGAGGGDAPAATEQGALCRAAEPLRHVQHGAAEGFARGGQRVAQRVQRQQRGLPAHRRRHAVERLPADEPRETTGGERRAHGERPSTRRRLRCQCLRSRQISSDGHRCAHAAVTYG
jgi:hypothetical protein